MAEAAPPCRPSQIVDTLCEIAKVIGPRLDLALAAPIMGYYMRFLVSIAPSRRLAALGTHGLRSVQKADVGTSDRCCAMSYFCSAVEVRCVAESMRAHAIPCAG